MAAAAPECETGHARPFRRQLQPARRGQRQATRHLSDDTGQPGVTQTLLHAQERGRRLAGFRVYDPIRPQPGSRERRREEIRHLEHPQHRPGKARQHAGDQQCRGSAMLGVRPAAGGLMQSAQAQAPGRQPGIDLRNPEGKDSIAVPFRSPGMGDPGLQVGEEDGCCIAWFHSSPRVLDLRRVGNI